MCGKETEAHLIWFQESWERHLAAGISFKIVFNISWAKTGHWHHWPFFNSTNHTNNLQQWMWCNKSFLSCIAHFWNFLPNYYRFFAIMCAVYYDFTAQEQSKKAKYKYRAVIHKDISRSNASVFVHSIELWKLSSETRQNIIYAITWGGCQL